MALKEVYFVDITKIGRDMVGNRDVSLLKNEQALLESISNIIQTEPGEKVMDPEFGCRLHRFLFEPINDITALYMQKEITDSIERFEVPARYNNLEVDVEPDEDNQTFTISIIFDMKVTNNQQEINFKLSKVR